MPWSFWAGYFAKLTLVALALAVIYVLARWLRRTQLFERGDRLINVVESTALSQHAALYLVRTGSRYFLIGSGVCMLAEITGAEDKPIR
jgi:flagellar biogenesis protein FliO